MSHFFEIVLLFSAFIMILLSFITIRRYRQKRIEVFSKKLKIKHTKSDFWGLACFSQKAGEKFITIEQKDISNPGRSRDQSTIVKIDLKNEKTKPFKVSPNKVFRLFSENFFGKFLSKLQLNLAGSVHKKNTIYTGDKEFDRVFSVEGEDGEATKLLFDEVTRKTMLKLKATERGFFEFSNAHSDYFTLELTHNYIKFTKRNHCLDHTYYKNVLIFLEDLARRIEK